jgi:hypothetical protein
MSRLHDAIAAVRGALDRDTLTWGVVPAATAALVTMAFVVPNYMRAGALRSESQLLDAVASENISQRNNLARMEESVASMREDAARRCRPLSADGERDGLLDAVTRHSDGLAVREQSIRTGPRETLPAPIGGMRLARREVTVEMTATFESIFGVIDSAEGVDRLVTPRVLEITAISTPQEQAILGNPAVRATIVIDEWSEAGEGEQETVPARAAGEPAAQEAKR